MSDKETKVEAQCNHDEGFYPDGNCIKCDAVSWSEYIEELQAQLSDAHKVIDEAQAYLDVGGSEGAQCLYEALDSCQEKYKGGDE